MNLKSHAYPSFGSYLRRSFLLLLCAAACGQSTLTISTRIVAVSAIVLDKHGAPVANLAKSDFDLYEDNAPVPIGTLTQDADRPLTLALMVDTSGSQKSFIADETSASELFFKAMLTRPEDRATLIQFDTGVYRLHSMTHEVDALETALTHLAEDHTALESYTPRGGTLLYDAVCATAEKSLAPEAGRRAMVLLTDGGDDGSRLTLDQAIACAQRADIVVYSVFYSEKPASDEGQYGRVVLETLSTATGGRVFTVGGKTPLSAIYTQIEADMRLQYQLTYRPANSTPGTYHRLKLKAKDKHLKVYARTGYFTRP